MLVFLTTGNNSRSGTNFPFPSSTLLPVSLCLYSFHYLVLFFSLSPFLISRHTFTSQPPSDNLLGVGGWEAGAARGWRLIRTFNAPAIPLGIPTPGIPKGRAAITVNLIDTPGHADFGAQHKRSFIAYDR